jgi:hypothetical protein
LFSLARAFSRPLSGKDPSIRLRMPARFNPERSSMSVILSKIKPEKPSFRLRSLKSFHDGKPVPRRTKLEGALAFITPQMA